MAIANNNVSHCALANTPRIGGGYHRYLDAEPEASNGDVVEARLGELERSHSSLGFRVGARRPRRSSRG